MKLKFSGITSTLFILGSMTVPVIAFLSPANAQNQPAVPEKTTQPRIEGDLVPPPQLEVIPIPNMREGSRNLVNPHEIKGKIVPSTEPDITPSQTEEITPQRVASPRNRVATFD